MTADRISEEAILAAHTRYQGGLTLRDLAQELECSPEAVRLRFKRAGLPTRPTPHGNHPPTGPRVTTDADVEMIVHLYRAGESAACISSKLGVAEETVRRRLLGAGETMRPPGRYKNG